MVLYVPGGVFVYGPLRAFWSVPDFRSQARRGQAAGIAAGSVDHLVEPISRPAGLVEAGKLGAGRACRTFRSSEQLRQQK